MKASKARWTALALALALAACGGGSSSSSSTDPGTGGDTTTPPAATNRIEPYDPSGIAKTQPQASVVHAAAGPQATRDIALGPLALAKAATPASARAPLQIGQARSVADTATVAATSALLPWQTTASGARVAALRFTAEGAQGVRLGVLVRALPAGAVLRFYGATDEGAIEVSADDLQAMARRNTEGGADDATARTYWSPDFGGAQTTLEVQIPAAASPAAVQLAVPRLSHLTVSPRATGIGAAGSCEVDVTCHPEYADQSRSVARMTYVDSGITYLCTGTLLNDEQSDGTPYFLSANHCVSTQAAASTLNTYWFFRSASCNSTTLDPTNTRLTSGATLLYASAATDTSFMRLNDAAPAGIVYAGSYFGGMAAGQALSDIHHPSGDLQKVSQGSLLNYSNCTENNASGDVTCTSVSGTNGNFYMIGWQQGVTEGGSSGSAALIAIGQRRYVAGQLYAGDSSCQNPTGTDAYGRFDASYNAALKNWLNPATP